MSRLKKREILPKSSRDSAFKNCVQNGEDCCVLCGRMSGYKTDEPLVNRRFYIEGGGQLCEQCFYRVGMRK